jgi:hypothetical protein
MLKYKLGLKPPRPGAVKLRLGTYCNFRKLPTPPTEFGHYGLIPATGWGVLGNQDWGDCAEAAACHQVMLLSKEGTGTAAPFDDAAALANYSAITGFDPNAGPPESNPTDGGTDLGQLADYWTGTGIVDSNGQHHPAVAVCDLNPGDLREFWVACHLFQSVTLGFALPQSAINQTGAGQVWDVVADDGGIQGGHCVPAFGRTAGLGVGVTWGLVQQFTPRFFETYCNQGFVVFSEEMMIKGADIDGFDDQLLRADLQAL